MPADLGLAAYDAAVTCAQLLIFIIKTVQQVKRLKAECAEVQAIATLLKNVIDRNKAVLNQLQAAKKLEILLQNVSQFVVSCTQTNIVRRVWEVTWKHRLPTLLKGMMLWVTLLNTETSVSSFSAMVELIQQSTEHHVTEQAISKNVSEMRLILEELKKNSEQTQPPLDLSIEFPETDTRLSVRELDDNTIAGSLVLPNAEAVKIVCDPIKEDLMRYGEKGPRHVLIYARLSANTLVHPFYGIAQRYGQRWAVMKDLRDQPVLGDAIGRKEIPDSILGRIGIAYDIAKTVDYLHSVEVLVKRLSDRNFVLMLESGIFTPYLTNLERARLFKEHTSGGAYDVRYEAPEFAQLTRAQHTPNTDVWSLGILIWELVSGSFPYDQPHEVFEGETAKHIREHVANSSLPWVNCPSTDPLLNRVAKIVTECCRPRPNVRPSAAYVAHCLFEIQESAAVNIDPTASLKEDVKSQVSKILDEADEAAKRGIEPASKKLDAQLTQELRDFVSQNDPVACFLYGSAIWYNLVDPNDDMDPLILAAGVDYEKELRARAAMPYLEFAFQAGIKAAAKPLKGVHRILALGYNAIATA